jgi:predicted regulator of Ras-like GTPase activity (Roadblock/LC7/MglB family)
VETLLGPLLEIEGVSGALLVGKDGLLIAGKAYDHDTEMIGAMAAACLGSLNRYTEQIGHKAVRHAIIETPQGSIQVREISADTLLVVLSTSTANLGRVRLDMARVAQRVRERVSSL